MTAQNYLLNFKYDVTIVDSGKCWCNRLTLPLINDPELETRNLLTILTRALFDNESELQVQGHIVNHSPDLILKDSYGFQPDPLWIYTREVNQAILNKAKHKSQHQLQVASSVIPEVSKVSFEPEFVSKMKTLDLTMHLSFIIDGDEISVTDGLHFVQGKVNNLSLLIDAFDGRRTQYA